MHRRSEQDNVRCGVSALLGKAVPRAGRPLRIGVADKNAQASRKRLAGDADRREALANTTLLTTGN
jgi:hypothetical protein